MTDLTIWTVLWVNPDGDGFAYRTPPADQRVRDEPEVRRYGPEDVIKYAEMLRRHIPVPGFGVPRFRCLSNVAIPGIDTVPLACPDLKGWWGKMELFRPGVAEGRNLYLDLDTIILQLDGVADWPTSFAAIKPGRRVGSNWHPRWLDQEGRTRVTGYQTSVMVWDAEYGHKFWEGFNNWSGYPIQCPDGGFTTTTLHGEYARREWMNRIASDQDFLADQFPNEGKLYSRWFAKIRMCPEVWRKQVRVVLSTPHKNDSAAKLYPWLREYWPYGN